MGISQTMVPKLWRSSSFQHYDVASEELQLFRVVVLDIPAAVIQDYNSSVDVILALPDEEGREKLEKYMQLVRSCDLAFINVVLDLYLDEMCTYKKAGKAYGGQAAKKKRGKKADKESLEHKEALYIEEVVALRDAHKAKEGEEEDELEK